MRRISLTLSFLLMCMGCEQPAAPNKLPAPTVPQEVEEVDSLTGIAQIRLNSDGSATLVDEEHTGEGVNLIMFGESGQVVNTITLQIGQSVRLSDGRHVTIWDTLTNVEGDRLTFQVMGRFDARAFGGDINIYRKTVVVMPYP